MIDTHALRVLEFEAIRKQLAGQTACSLGRELAEAVLPLDWLPQVQARLDETTEIGAILEAHGLLDIAEAAAASRSLKLFLQKLAADYPLMAERASALG